MNAGDALRELRDRVRALPTGVELDAYAPEISTTREFREGAIAMQAVVVAELDALLSELPGAAR